MKIRYLIIIMLILPTVLAYTSIQYSSDNLTWRNATTTDEKKIIIEKLGDGINESTNYFFRVRHHYENGTSNWTYISGRTKQSGEKSMGSLSVTVFVLICALGFLVVPFLVKQFTRNEFSNLILKRCCFIVGVYLMMLNSAILSTISSVSNLGVEDEMFRYMWLFGWVGYGLMVYLVLKTILDILAMWRMKKDNERMGGDLID